MKCKTMFKNKAYSILMSALLCAVIVPAVTHAQEIRRAKPNAAQTGEQAVPSTPAVQFHPEKAWSVSEPAAGQCNLSNTFNNGFVVQIVSTKADRTPEIMAVDFRQNIFEAGQNYPVTLNVPGLSELSVDGVAANAQTLSFSVASDDLITAMQASKTLDLSLDENSFRFYLSGLENGLRAFQTCGRDEKVKPQAQNDALADQDESAPTKPEDRAYLDKVINGFEDDVKSSFALDSQKDGVKPDLPALDQTDDTDAPKSTKISSRIKGTKEIAKFEADFTAIDDDDDNDKGKDENKPFATRGTLIKTSKGSALNADDLDHDLDEVIERTVSDPDPVITPSLEEIDVVDVASVPAVTAAQEEPKGVRRATPKRSGISDQDVQIAELKKQIRLLKHQNTILDEELKQTLESTKQERIVVASENWNLERATVRFNEAERQIERLGGQLQKERASCLAEKQKLESLLFDPSLTANAQLSSLTRLEDENAALKARIRALEDRLR